ncbi:hypothetical protein CXZ10_02730 [Pleomorphomonas diazotrophica]|uniref:Polysaccharide chain length determinant N-terminal domain-containing protein n=1 Tax=Pleomorphomonas diazotrophica TaxID=1166257 RepID=A0A1I4QZ24_9HYPH|nr:hypothetical protein [Pleomorphomonas diazotrophica]PKR90315.1 hypothetical protein CXZ10_02730 [Pleomorphomonas diazotrophica]SFM45324.1 hypothetical protein SAMN05192571_101774 [Pleomorphomonas diazotrophica]
MNVFGVAPAGEAGDGLRPSVLRSALRRKAVLLALAASVALAAFGALSALPSGVEIRARLAIDRKGTAESVVDAAFLESQAKLITSRDTLRRAASELGITDAGTLSKPPLYGRVLTALGMGGKLVSPEERLTDTLAAGFSAQPSGRGRSIDIRFSAENADLAIRFVDRVIADYLALQGTSGGVGARLVSGAAPVELAPGVSPWAGAALAGLSVLALGGAAAALGLWRRRETGEMLEETPLAVGVLEPLNLKDTGGETALVEDAAAAASSSSPPVAIPGVDLAERRRVAVASFGEGGENRRLIDELALAGGFNGARIVVVDASRRTDDRPGLAELLIGEADFSDVIQRNAASRAHEIGPGLRSLAALANDTEAAMLLETLEQTYDLVLIDLGRLRADPAFTLFARLAGQLMLTGEADPAAVDTLLAALGRRGVTSITRVATPAGELAA